MKLKTIADCVGAEFLGDENIEVSGVSGVHTASAVDLVFVEDEINLQKAILSPASAVIAGGFASNAPCSKPLLISKQPRLAFARAAKLLAGRPESESGIHPTALIATSARLGKDVTIGPNVVIEDNVEIGDETAISAGSVVCKDAKIGSRCFIHPNVSIYPRVNIGDRVIIHAGAVLGSDGFGYVRDDTDGHHEQFPQIGSLEIKDDVEIGANCTIDRGALAITRVGRGTKIDNLVHIGHNCEIGEDVLIAAQTGLSGSITLGNNVSLGGQVGVGEHARIEEGVKLGGQGGVLPHKVLRGKGMSFWGTPARPVREFLKQLAILERMGKKN